MSIHDRPRRFHSDFLNRCYGVGWTDGKAEGFAAGMASALILVLDARRVPLSFGDRLSIDDCRELEQLELWLSRAVVVDSVDELFA